MKKYGKEVVIVLLFALACAALFLLSGETFTLLSDATADRLLQETLARAVTFALLLPVLFLCGCGRSLYGKTTLRVLLWCLPCLLVAICNFPFHALLTGAARIGRTDLLWLFALNCLCVGLMEELLFRGLLQPLLMNVLRRQGVILPVLIDAGLFGLWHLTNLLVGADVGATLLQV